MKIIRFFMKIIIWCTLLFLVITSMFIICSKTLVSKDNIANFVSQANILNVDINILFNQEQSGKTLKEKLFSLALENEIPEEIIEDVLKSKQINDLLGDFFNQTISYAINGGNKPKILDETIDKIKLIAKQSLDNHLNVMVEEEQLNLYIENYCESIVNIVPKRNEMIGNIPIYILEYLLNFNVIYIYLIIVLFLLLITIMSKNWYKFIQYLGVTMLISGLLFVTIGSMEYIISNLISTQITLMQPFVLPLITNLLTIWFKSGVLVSFSSIVLILIYLTINRMSKTKL